MDTSVTVYNTRPFGMLAIEAIRITAQAGLRAVIVGIFQRIDTAEFVFRIEIVIDTKIDLVAIVLVVRVAIRNVQSINPARESDPGGVQTVADGVVVR